MQKWIITILLTATCSAGAQQAETADPMDSEWAKIRQLESVYEEAVTKNDVEKLRPIVAKGFHGVLVNGREVNGFDDLVTANQEIRQLIGAGGVYRIKISHKPGTMIGDVAIAHGTADEMVKTGGGKEFSFQSFWTVNLIKEDGQWKLFRIQATLDPVNNVFVKDTLKFVQIAFGAGGIVLGVLAGFVLRGLRR
ncbi:MAG: nuclear transport factor 2 family protein [Bryobacteraceae bacterium]